MAATIPDACCTPAPSTSFLAGGKEEKWSTLDVYVSGAETCSAAIILASDVYGWKLPQLRQLADWLAFQGFLVAIPDFFHNDPIVPDVTDRVAWFANHSALDSVKEAVQVVEHLKAAGIQRIGGAGFCWGGKLVANLRGLEAVAMLHPARVTVEEIKALMVPIAILAAEIDSVTPTSLVEEYRIAVDSNSEIASKSLVKIFPGVKHGFSIRYDSIVEEKAAFEARQDLVTFFSENLD